MCKIVFDFKHELGKVTPKILPLVFMKVLLKERYRIKYKRNTR